MGWLSRLRRKRNSHRASLVCYLRENGPIAYASDLFGGDPRERAEAMLSTGLGWYWKTTAEHSVRDWTLLTRWSLAALLADLAVEHDGLKPHIVAIGIDPQDMPGDVTDSRAATWMRGFSSAAAAPLHAVVSRPAPGGDLVFVAQQPPEAVRGLLQAWEIDRDTAERRPYARLHGNSLEDLTRSLHL